MLSTLQILNQLYTDIIEKKDLGLSPSELNHLLLETLLSSRNKSHRPSGGDYSYSGQMIAKRDGRITYRHGEELKKYITERDGSFERINNTIHEFENQNLEGKTVMPEKDTKQVSEESPCDVPDGSEERKVPVPDRSCDYQSSSRHGCKEIPLMLTCLKLMFERQIPEEGQIEEEEEYVRVKTSTGISLLMEELVNTDILSVLLCLVDDGDRFISYSASKAILAAVKCRSFHEKRETLLQDVLVMAVRPGQSATGAVFLDLIKHFMSNRSGKQTNTWCFNTLQSSQIFRLDFVKNTLTDIETTSIDKPVAFLSLLQKTVKYVNKQDKDTKQEHLQSLIDPIQEELLRFLVKCLEDVDLCQWRVLGKKTLDIFNTLLPYGSHLAPVKDIPSFYSQTACKLVSVLQPSVLTSMPYVRQYVCFGGSTVERTDEGQHGDLALLRKLFLLMLKSCAVILRTQSSSFLDRQQVATCLTSLPDWIQKTFLPAAADFKWLPLVFGDQDDAWVEALLCLLDVHLHSPRISTSSTTVFHSPTSPHALFLQFLDSNSCDHMIIVDLLTSPETCFLLYLLRYLKCAISEWNHFTVACHCNFPHRDSTNSINSDDCKLIDSLWKGASETPNVSCLLTKMPNTSDNGSVSPISKKLKIDDCCEENDKNVLDAFGHTEAYGSAVMMQPGTGGLASLTAYSDSDSCTEDDDVTSESVSTCALPCSKVHSTRVDNSLLENSGKILCDKDTCTYIINIPSKTSQLRLTSDFRHLDSELPQKPEEGSTVSCDLQCMETVMSALIRVRLRIERLADQDLFPYSPDPLLSLIEHCESLYEHMGSQNEEVQ